MASYSAYNRLKILPYGPTRLNMVWFFITSHLTGNQSLHAPLTPLGDGEGQGSLVCCSPWGHKESDTMERLNNQHLS